MRPRGSLRGTPRATAPGRLLAADAGLILAAAHGAAHPARLVLLALALAAGYALLCLVRPIRRCPKCKGTQITERGGRHQPCRRCRGTGRARRLGATAVHRFFWATSSGQRIARRHQHHGDRN